MINLQKQIRTKSFQLQYKSVAEKKLAVEELAAMRVSGVAQSKYLNSVIAEKETYEKERINAIGKSVSGVEARINELKSSIALAALTSQLSGNLAGAAAVNPGMSPSKLREEDSVPNVGGSGGVASSGYGGSEERELHTWWLSNQQLIASARDRWRSVCGLDAGAGSGGALGSDTPPSGSTGTGSATASVVAAVVSPARAPSGLDNSWVDLTQSPTPPAQIKPRRANDNKIGGSGSTGPAPSPSPPSSTATISADGVDVIKTADEAELRSVRVCATDQSIGLLFCVVLTLLIFPSFVLCTRSCQAVLELCATGVSRVHALIFYAQSIARLLRADLDRLRTALTAANDTRKQNESLARQMTVSESERAEEENERMRLEYYGIRNRLFTESRVLLTVRKLPLLIAHTNAVWGIYGVVWVFWFLVCR